MAMGRSFRVFHNINAPPPYSLYVEQRAKQEVLLFESQAILTLGSAEVEPLKKSHTKLADAYGILGVLRLNIGDGVLHYLCLVTGCVSAGKLGSADIYKVTDVKLLSLRGHNPDEERVGEIRKLLTNGSCYFSWSNLGPEHSIDLTLSAQKCHQHTDSDNRFFWNRMLHLPFVRAGVQARDWLISVMVGSIEVRTVYVGAKQAKAAIVSRLSNERAGTRFAVRGVNDFGHVANFVETEQLIQIDDEVASYLQIRGSVPLFWEQPGVNIYLVIIRKDNTEIKNCAVVFPDDDKINLSKYIEKNNLKVSNHRTLTWRIQWN